MKQRTKELIQYSIFGVFIILGIIIGYILHKNLQTIGVTFVTFKDIVSCYMGSIVVLGLIGLWFTGVYLEKKIKATKEWKRTK